MHDPSLNGDIGSQRLAKSKSPGSRKCDCCPYGYHLDLDFVRYCEKVGNSQLFQARHTLPSSRAWRKKRESRETLLGIKPTQPTTQQSTDKADSCWVNGGEDKNERFSDELAKAVSDFEKMLNSSLRGTTIDQRLLENKKSRDVELELSCKSVDKIHDKPSHYTEGARLSSGGTNNASPVTLQEIREQMASSLSKMKKLEEEGKRIPNLENQIQKLRLENRRLMKLIEAKSDRQKNATEKIKGREGKEDAIRHTRTIGTGCTVLMRDVSTWDRVVHTTTGTNPSPPLTNSMDRQTNTDPLSRVLKEINETQKELLKKSSTNCSVQTNDWPVKVPTKHHSSQTDENVSKVSTHDACVQCTTPKRETTSYSRGCQVDMAKKIFLKSDKSVQIDKTLCFNANTQTDNVASKIPNTKDFSSQVGKIPQKVTKKDFGSQNKPLVVDIGIGSSLKFTENCCQTQQPERRDKGVNVAEPVRLTKLANIGVNTETERKYSHKPITVSKLTDTFDLCKKVEISVDASPVLVSVGIDAQDLTDRWEKDTDLKTNKDDMMRSSTPTKLFRTHSVQNWSEKIEKELSTEDTDDIVSPSVSIISKPYEKKAPPKEMKGAMKVLNDSLQKSPAGDMPKSMRNAINIIQQEWFKISSTAEANPLDVEDYIDCFEELSVDLLEYIVNMTDVSGNTAMHYAVSNGNFDVVSILLDSKVCNINKLNTAGYTCIMLVALAKVKSAADRQVVRRLFHMADVNIRAKQHGQTALMLAVSHGRIDTVELLLESGADINIQDEDGSTALMCAAEHGYIDIVKLLLAQPDCDLTITDLDGNTALNIAMEAGNRDIGVLLYAQEHFSRGTSPFSSLKTRRAKSSTPTLKTRTPTPPNCSQEHSL